MGKLEIFRDLLDPVIHIFQHGQDLPIKQARIKREKTKEEYKPFLTILGTSQRAAI